MCLKPILIDNPYYGCNKTYKGAGGTLHLERTFAYLHDTTTRKMAVPCGHCAQCVAMKQSYIVQRSQMEAHGNDLWFCTLTYKTSMLRYIDVNGYRLKYADISDVQNMIKRLRRKNALGLPFRFWCVVEYGGKKHRPHYHLIFSTPKIKGETLSQKRAREKEYFKIILGEWRRNVATTIALKGRKKGYTIPNTRAPKYVNLCDYKVSWKNGKRRSTYDFHWIDPTVTDGKGKLHDESDVAFYVTKYTVKANKYVDRLKSALRLNLDPDEFVAIWRLLRPKVLVSKKWGDPDSSYVRHHVREGIDRAIQDPDALFPFFINPHTGQTFPLAPFYKSKMFTFEDAHSFFYKNKDDFGTGDNFRLDPDRDPIEVEAIDKRFLSMKARINAREEEDPYYTYINTDDYEKETNDSDWLIYDLLDFSSCRDMLECSLPPDPEYGIIPDYGDLPSEYYGDDTTEFSSNDFDCSGSF